MNGVRAPSSVVSLPRCDDMSVATNPVVAFASARARARGGRGVVVDEAALVSIGKWAARRAWEGRGVAPVSSGHRAADEGARGSLRRARPFNKLDRVRRCARRGSYKTDTYIAAPLQKKTFILPEARFMFSVGQRIDHYIGFSVDRSCRCISSERKFLYFDFFGLQFLLNLRARFLSGGAICSVSTKRVVANTTL